MLKLKNRDNRTLLDEEIDDLLEDMALLDRSSNEYADMVNHVEKLYKAKSYDESKSISNEAKVSIAANLLGIILILGYEKADIITSRAINFVSKVRV